MDTSSAQVSANPFLAAARPVMTRMRIPAHMARQISAGGFECEADANGFVEVPEQHVAALLSHGLMVAPAPAGLA